MTIEELAYEHYGKDSADDDCRFPNHTDRDIWMDGFKAGYESCTKIIRDRLHQASLKLSPNPRQLIKRDIILLIENLNK